MCRREWFYVSPLKVDTRKVSDRYEWYTLPSEGDVVAEKPPM